jgi:hypothetical protein
VLCLQGMDVGTGGSWLATWAHARRRAVSLPATLGRRQGTGHPTGECWCGTLGHSGGHNRRPCTFADANINGFESPTLGRGRGTGSTAMTGPATIMTRSIMRARQNQASSNAVIADPPRTSVVGEGKQTARCGAWTCGEF